jgi:hypothetical protein
MNDVKEARKMGIHAFIKGFASAFDLGGHTYVSIPDLTRGAERDREALKGDWTRVGSDIRHAMFIVSNE